MEEEKKLPVKPEYVIDVILRYRWLIMVPLCASVILGIYFAIVLPKIYQAQTLILVEPQRVPTNYVQSVVSQDINARIDTISQQILSRTNLEKIISEYGLFEGPDYAGMFIEDKIENMRRRIDVSVTRARRGADAFSITFYGKDPKKVMDVTNTLGTYFIDENLKVREAQAVGTSDFLDSELDDMRKRLEGVEEALKVFRKTHMGELPEQLDSNIRILENLQDQLVEQQKGLRDAKNRLSELERQLEAQAQSEGRITILGQPAEDPELAQLKTELAALKARYTAQHPDVIRVQQRLAERQAELKRQPIATPTGNPEEPIRTTNPAVYRMQAEIGREIDTFTREIEDLNAQIAVYQQRVENTPKREQELMGLKRDYDNIQESYNSLLARRLEAEISVNMERKQKGEQFRILDPARLPQKPIKPNLRMLFIIFIGLGLSIGGGIVFLLEFFNTGYKDPDDVEENLGIPVFVAIPSVLQKRELRLRRFNTVFSSLYLLFTISMVGGFAIMTLKGVDRTLAFIGRILPL